MPFALQWIKNKQKAARQLRAFIIINQSKRTQSKKPIGERALGLVAAYKPDVTGFL
jgi:hypothetical protein